MPKAIQLPYVKDPAKRAGRRLFRKQVLPAGTIEHPRHGDVSFDLAGIRERFMRGAMDQVPFLIADNQRDHPESGGDPDRVRGEVKGLDLADDGLYALVETTDLGAELLADNPKLPVSVRVQKAESGEFKGKEILAHVLGTLDPVAKGMKAWEAIEAAADTEVTDLSEGSFSHTPIGKEADTQGKEALSDEEKGTLRKLVGKLTGKAGGEPDPKADPKKEEPGKEPELSDEEVEKAVAELIADAGKEGEGAEPEPGKEPVAASLSDEDRKTLDMANDRAEKAEKDAREMTLKTGRTELSNTFKEYVRDGVPPAQVNAAKAKIEGKDDTVIDFARGKQSVELDALFAALDAAKGTIDFSERGSSVVADDEDEEKAKARRKDAEAAADAWAGRS